MSEFDSFIDAATTPHWLIVPFLAIGSWFARILIGRHLKTLDVLKEGQIANRELMLDQFAQVDHRLSRLEGRFQERDRNGRSTWPGDSQ
jgi:hypothetical protein